MDENYLWIGDPTSLFYVLFIRFWVLICEIVLCVLCFFFFFFFVLLLLLLCGLGVFLFFNLVHVSVIFWS